MCIRDRLSRAVAEGRFRQDLFYRVNVINIELPSLRERISDIPLLAQHFLASVCEESGRKVEGFTDEALTALRRYQWPGNVRELQNVIERAVLLGKGPRITTSDLPNQLASGAPVVVPSSSGVSLKNALDAPERQIILEALQSNAWNRNATAELLGINLSLIHI